MTKLPTSDLMDGSAPNGARPGPRLQTTRWPEAGARVTWRGVFACRRGGLHSYSTGTQGVLLGPELCVGPPDLHFLTATRRQGESGSLPTSGCSNAAWANPETRP